MIEIEPGGIKKLGKIYPQDELGIIGEQIRASREQMFEHYDDSRGRFRYQIYRRTRRDDKSVGNVYIDEQLYEWLESCSELMHDNYRDGKQKLFWIKEGVGKLEQTRGINISLLYHDNGFQLGWHIDYDLDLRLMTNVGQDETIVWSAVEWGPGDLMETPDSYRIPQEYEAIVIEPGETYVVNNIVYFHTPDNDYRRTPHATPIHPGRSILQQSFEWRGDPGLREWDTLHKLGGLTICTDLDSPSLWLPACFNRAA